MMQHRTNQPPGLSSWLAQLMARAHQNVVIVALANKLLRMAWAVLCKNEIVSDSGSGLSSTETRIGVMNFLPGLLADY